MKLIKISKIVKEVLETYPETRNDDYLLWLRVIAAYEVNNDLCGIETMTVYDFLKTAKSMPIPCFESVSRARRKIQEQNPDLRAEKEVQEARAELEGEYIEFARHKEAI